MRFEWTFCSIRNRLASGVTFPGFLMVNSHDATHSSSVGSLKTLYDHRLIFRNLFPAFLTLAPYPVGTPAWILGSVRTEKAMEAQLRGGAISR